MSYVKNPDKHNAAFIARAMEAARTFGEGFVVYVAGMAVLGTHNKESAQEEARRWAINNGREVVRVKRVRVPDARVK